MSINEAFSLSSEKALNVTQVFIFYNNKIVIFDDFSKLKILV